MFSPRSLYSVAEIREIERKALARRAPGALMQKAGAAAAELAAGLHTTQSWRPDVLVLAGPGNNGGDGLECAYRLAQYGHKVTVLHFAALDRLPDDARAALGRASAAPVRFVPPGEWEATIRGTPWTLVVDALFGIGLGRALEGDIRAVVETVNKLPCPILALDIPSGLDADTGNIVGTEGIAVQATHTITYIGAKPGLYTGHGRDYAGQVSVASLDIADELFPPPSATLGAPDAFASCLRPRPHASHKGSYGDVVVVGGSHGMTGAAILASRTAAMCGAGRVFAAFLDAPPAFDPLHPELMFRSFGSVDMTRGALVVGPGLGTAPQAADAVLAALRSGSPAIVDADALNLIAANAALREALAARQHPALLTPHPLEAARLLDTNVAGVQADRLAAARRLAHELRAVVVLKGSGSVIAAPDGRASINPTGNPALATAGSGDVLAGACGALLAQGWPAREAALGAAWLHGQAADDLVAQGIGPIGLTAGELPAPMRVALNRLVEQLKPAGRPQS